MIAVELSDQFRNDEAVVANGAAAGRLEMIPR